MFRQHPAVAVLIVILFTPYSGMAQMQEVRFAGAVSQPDRSGESLILRKFEAMLLTADQAVFFSVLDDEKDGCPWPESFWQNGADRQPHLIHEYDGHKYTVVLPPLILDLPEQTDVGTEWTTNHWTFEVTEKVDDKWKISAKERRGRRQELTVSVESGLLSDARMDVFMGQGERFELQLRQTTSASMPSEKAEQTRQLQSELLALQASLKRRPDSQLTELSHRQIEDSVSKIDLLTRLAKDTPLQESVLRIRRDISRQERRVAETMKRKDQLLGKKAPGFVLNLLTGGTKLESESLKGRTVILHFWKYSDKPLSEPYGQIGYLQFLYSKRKAMKVDVIGVAMNPSLQQQDTFRSASRGARKLSEFMNLKYPIGYDDGSLLRELGDPRSTGGELPLWIVLAADGTVVHYHTGFYEIDRRQGLKELDEIVIKQIQAAAQ